MIPENLMRCAFLFESVRYTLEFTLAPDRNPLNLYSPLFSKRRLEKN